MYDIRTKSVVHEWPIESRDPIVCVAFQPVKWVQEACSHDPLVPTAPKQVSSGLTPQQKAPPNVLDMFSPVGRNS